MHLYRCLAILVYLRVAVTSSSQEINADNDKKCYGDNLYYSGTPDQKVNSLQAIKNEEDKGECAILTTDKATKQSILHQKPDDTGDAAATTNDADCSLYMAESSIPNAGLGVYTARSLSKGEVLNVPEVILTHVDLFDNMRMSQLFTTETEPRQFYNMMNGKTDLSPKECVVLALNGFCDNDTNTRTRDCAKTCAIHLAGLDVKKTMIFHKDLEDSRWCKRWAEEGECNINPNFMLQECALSCVNALYGLYTETKESRADWLPSHYYWMDEGVGTQFEAKGASTFIPGLGSLPNSHMGLVNMGLRGHTYDNVGYHRSRDVGVGAFSSRHNMTIEAIEYVPAGMELFLNYGDQYFTSKTKLLGQVPLEDDYKEANKLLSEFLRNAQEQIQDDNENNNADSKVASMYDEMLNSIQNPRLKNALPPNYEIIVKEGKNKSAAMLSVPNVIRSSEWLAENGMCIDTLHPGPSTVPQAGRGAFASRSIQMGQVIAHIPLLHMDRQKLRRFVGAEEITPQLSINYSYGHENSSMVLLPYSPVVNFVNHNFDRSKINAKLKWSTRSLHQRHWEHDTVSEILPRQRVGLMMELIAIQDIPSGHEVFLYYGSRWEKAWMAHVSNWKPPTHSDDYDNVEDLNHPENVNVRTLEEQRDRPYGKNVVTLCWLDLIKLFSDVRRGSDHNRHWENYRVERSGTSQSANDNVAKKCEIIQRLETPPHGELEGRSDGEIKPNTVYTVSVRFDATGSTDVFIEGVPRSEIFFENKKYTSDQFLKNAFRHVIDIPDDVFPAAWKNLDGVG